MNQADIFGLGINCYAHDAAVALLKNGEVLFTAEEERFDRKKHSSAFPVQALKAGLKQTGLSLDLFSYCSFYQKPWITVFGNIGYLLRFFPDSIQLLRSTGGSEHSQLVLLGKQLSLLKEIERHFGPTNIHAIEFIEHHLAHAASAFYPSSFEEAAILTWDGRGEKTTTQMAVANGNEIKVLQKDTIPHSLGLLYTSLTAFLGFKPFHDEWKVMGMAAYGTKSGYLQKMADLVKVDDNGRVTLDLSYFSFHVGGTVNWVSQKFYDEFGPARIPNSELSQRHFDIALALQGAVETSGLQVARSLRKRSGQKNLCMTGGVALNVLLNQKIMADSGFQNFFVQPVASDSGTSFGSALYYYHQVLGNTKRSKGFSPYLGCEFSDQEIIAALNAQDLKYSRADDIFASAAEYLTAGKIIGWFQGRQEAGPRALGNRSILANPTLSTMKDEINLRIKRRESFRPFAPSIPEELCLKYFDMPHDEMSPYMISAGRLRSEFMGQFPAVTHNDGSARVHTVSSSMNFRFWKLLNAYHKVSGHPILLNTSFNENEPIVNTPQEAIACFLKAGVDVLVLGDYLVLPQKG